MIKLNSEFLNPHTQYDESLMTIMTANNLNLILLKWAPQGYCWQRYCTLAYRGENSEHGARCQLERSSLPVGSVLAATSVHCPLSQGDGGLE